VRHLTERDDSSQYRHLAGSKLNLYAEFAGWRRGGLAAKERFSV
jgi:hypothetical protein